MSLLRKRADSKGGAMQSQQQSSSNKNATSPETFLQNVLTHEPYRVNMPKDVVQILNRKNHINPFYHGTRSSSLTSV